MKGPLWLETGRTPARGAAGGHFRGALKAMGRSLDFVVMRCKATAGLRDGSDVFWFVFYRNPSVCVYKIDSREVKDMSGETGKEVIVITQLGDGGTCSFQGGSLETVRSEGLWTHLIVEPTAFVDGMDKGVG